jgi:hypothetical protein
VADRSAVERTASGKARLDRIVFLEQPTMLVPERPTGVRQGHEPPFEELLERVREAMLDAT